jgi:OOP family OmpA-OmpF porin
MKLAKQALLALNDDVPELGYDAALDLFAPNELVIGPTTFAREAFGNAIEAVREDRLIFDRLTPMGPGIDDLPSVLRRLKGDMAVILVSDGRENVGEEPFKVVNEVYREFPNTCFHVISVADNEDEEGKKTLDRIAGMKDCSAMIHADKLINDAEARKEFVRQVFYRMEAEAPKPKPVKPDEVRLRDIHFEFDESEIEPKWVPVLEKQLSIIRSMPNWDIRVEGHTDAIDTVEYNQELSERRADRVRDWLIREGVDSDRITIKGYSELRPIATNETPEGRRLNRRAVIVLIRPES